MFFNKHSDDLYDLLRKLYLKMFMYLCIWIECRNLILYTKATLAKSSGQNIKHNRFYLFWILDYNLSKNDNYYTIFFFFWWQQSTYFLTTRNSNANVQLKTIEQIEGMYGMISLKKLKASCVRHVGSRQPWTARDKICDGVLWSHRCTSNDMVARPIDPLSSWWAQPCVGILRMIQGLKGKISTPFHPSSWSNQAI